MKGDIKIKDKKNWFYSDKVKKHFFNPVKFLKDDETFDFNGEGVVGSPACGDVMKFWIKVDKSGKKIVDCRWRTYGCASAIASTSALAQMITKNGGMAITRALKLKPQDILKHLGGLPSIKIHCSVLGDKALHKAIEDYKKKYENKNK